LTRYAFAIAGRSHHVTLEEHATGPRYVVDGTAFEPTVQVLGKGHYKVNVDGRTFEFQVQNGVVMEGPQPLDLEVRRARPELVRKNSAGRKSDGRIKPPMPGKIVEVKVTEGQTVAEGEVLCVLEAMKMQNDLKSPMAGTVRRVHVRDGATVEATTVLVEIEGQGQS
jgi:biotin carboxyl carrier protein